MNTILSTEVVLFSFAAWAGALGAIFLTDIGSNEKFFCWIIVMLSQLPWSLRLAIAFFGGVKREG